MLSQHSYLAALHMERSLKNTELPLAADKKAGSVKMQLPCKKTGCSLCATQTYAGVIPGFFYIQR